ncbi:NnrS family protein [Aliiroseovarius sp. PrR006]|uniref:NnrS family protein n=1 Tax=Aliiroseovarius sp. PrR006 TaxID=2706883 RepID=UPI0013D37708|nr:NnrS family protein [Aliiroseovarius sp. PrR006]NDW53371.1 NnrS family protein [Aliiroseovarius sp. PrR006]
MGDIMIILTGAYRLFFPSAALFAGLSIPLWLLSHAGGTTPTSDPYLWHQHEMLWGYLPAALVGFLFTAIPNWTGRPALSPMALLALFTLWLAGRAAMFVTSGAVAPQILAASFLPVAAVLALREVVAAGNKRNIVVVAMVGAFWVAQLVFLWLDTQIGLTIGFAVALLLMTLIGGRVTPAFSRNWLKKRGATHLPAEFGTVDKSALILTMATALLWIITDTSLLTGSAAALATLAQALRLSRWRGLAVWKEPLLFAQHAAYAWIVIGLGLLTAVCLGDWASSGQAHHALGAGAIGSMTAIVMLRALLGHSGRPIEATRADTILLITLHLGAALRICADWVSDPTVFYHAGGTLWAVAMIALAIRAFPIAIAPRL